MPLLTRWYLRSGLAGVVLAPAAGVFEAWPRGRSAPVLLLRPAAVHMLVVGWLTQVVFGVAHWMFPPPRGENHRSPGLGHMGTPEPRTDGARAGGTVVLPGGGSPRIVAATCWRRPPSSRRDGSSRWPSGRECGAAEMPLWSAALHPYGISRPRRGFQPGGGTAARKGGIPAFPASMVPDGPRGSAPLRLVRPAGARCSLVDLSPAHRGLLPGATRG